MVTPKYVNCILLTMTACFLVLKLAGVIAWPWWWVLAPIWIPTSLQVLALMFLLLIRGALYSLEKKQETGSWL